MGETIPKYLRRMWQKDYRKHGSDDGWRTPREVAEFYGISLVTARNRLNKLADAGEIEVAKEGCGSSSPLLWRQP